MDIGTALTRFLRHQRTEGRSPRTVDTYRYYVTKFAAYLAEQGHGGDLDDLCADDLRGFLDTVRERGQAAKTVQSTAVHVKAFTRWLVEEEYVDRDPFRKVKRPRADDVVKPTLTPAEVETLLAACNRHTATGARNFAMLLLLYSTGLRASEVVNLQVADVDHAKGTIAVRRGKGGRFRVVPLGLKVERALDKYLNHRGRHASPHLFTTSDGQPLTYNGLKLVLVRLEAKTGIHCNPHMWRHTAAITYLRNGGRVETLRAMLGHSTLDMTLHYARIAGVDLAAAHELADPARSLKTRV